MNSELSEIQQSSDFKLHFFAIKILYSQSCVNDQHLILSVLRECNRESLIQRSIPMGTGLGLLAYYCVKQGYLSGSTRFGAGPKVLLGATIGYFAGKISYQQKCAEKLMRLPNSRLAEMLRYSKGSFIKDVRKKT